MVDKSGRNDQRAWADRTFEGGTKGLLGCLAIPLFGLLGVTIAMTKPWQDIPAEQAPSPPVATEVAAPPPPATPAYTAAQRSMMCRAGIAAEFGRSPKIMKASEVEEGLTRVEYRRPDDDKLWKSDCRIEGNRIVWRTVDAFSGSGPGRWRTSAEDDVLTFTIEGKSVTTTSSDGSSANETYRF